MTDDPVRTRITTPAGVAHLPGVPGQARRRRGDREHRDDRHRRAPARRPGVLEAIAAAEAIVICPSSPVVSIGTILGGAGRARRARRAPRGLRGGQPDHRRRAGRGPGRTASSPGAGYPECSATQMARIYADVAATFVLDSRDAGEAAGDRRARRAPGADRRPHARPPAARPGWRPRCSRRSRERAASGPSMPVKPLRRGPAPPAPGARGARAPRAAGRDADRRPRRPAPARRARAGCWW